MLLKLLKRYAIPVLIGLFFDYILIVSFRDMLDNNPLIVVILAYVAIIGYNIGMGWHIYDFLKKNRK